jgi:hypothetical protein
MVRRRIQKRAGYLQLETLIIALILVLIASALFLPKGRAAAAGLQRTTVSLKSQATVDSAQ